MTETGAALAVTDYDERCETEALTALYGFRHAVDVHELFDQLFAAIVVARATIVTATTATVTAATVAAWSASTTATTAARCLAIGGGGCGCFGSAFDVLYFVCHD